jgi:hypothetical protein
MEKALFNELLEQANTRKRADNGFKKEAWTTSCAAVELITTQTVTIDQCKSKTEIMKALWKEFEWLKDQSGFGYEEETGLITASDSCWREMIRYENIDDLYI